MKPILRAWLSVGLAALIMPALALGTELTPQISYVYYSVPYAPGLSATEMILRHSPVSGDGRHIAGYTRYSIKHELGFTQPTIDVCRVDEPRITCNCEITLPRLEGGESDPETRRLFEVELNKINRHEQSHCDIAVRHARDLLKVIRKLKDMPCGKTDEVISARFREMEEACRVDQARFDNEEYGFKEYLRAEGRQRMMDAGFNLVPPVEYDPAAGSAAAGRPGNLQSVTPPNDQEFKQKGIYKDETGVWRNY